MPTESTANSATAVHRAKDAVGELCTPVAVCRKTAPYLVLSELKIYQLIVLCCFARCD